MDNQIQRQSRLPIRSAISILAFALLFSFSSAVLAQDEDREYKPRDPEELKREKEEQQKKDGSWKLIKKITLKPNKVHNKTLVGWQNGRIRRFRFEVLKRPVMIEEVEVHYGKGSSDLYEINEVIGVGELSASFRVDKDEKIYVRKLYIRYTLPEPKENVSDKDLESEAIIRLMGNRK